MFHGEKKHGGIKSMINICPLNHLPIFRFSLLLGVAESGVAVKLADGEGLAPTKRSSKGSTGWAPCEGFRKF